MKRTALLFGALVLAVAGRAQAQLTMQMSNGWSFTFAGNINAFAVYEHNNKNGNTNATPAAIVAPGDLTGFRVRTGLLPAFAVFEAKGKEGNTNLGVHFGFAPQIQSPHDNFGNGTQAGAQIDMRQLFLTVAGSWGQILAGRELGLFQRQNILNDQTLFGIGATGGNGAGANGTTLGRIGYGYIYPNFVAQITYSTVGGKPGQLSIGLFDPSPLGGVWGVNKVPRIEAEGTWKSGKLSLWVNGTVQNGPPPRTP
ncbi:MAG: porin, partial [Gemmatimonadales bacterium]